MFVTGYSISGSKSIELQGYRAGPVFRGQDENHIAPVEIKVYCAYTIDADHNQDPFPNWKAQGSNPFMHRVKPQHIG